MEKANTRNGVIIGAVGGTMLVLVLSLIWLRSYFFVTLNEQIFDSVLSLENPTLIALQEAEQESLSTYGWMDEERGVVRIPIDRAMDLVAEEASR